MEIKARYVIIGAFTLVILTAGFMFVRWAVTGRAGDGQQKAYDIYFQGSVSGLSTTGDVYFNGINVGRVESISVVPEDPGQVRVRIWIGAGTPIRKDSVASLEYQGITGVSAVQIRGGSPESPPLEPSPGAVVAVIPSRSSSIQELLSLGPQLIDKGLVLLEQAGQLFSPQNLASVGRILDNVESLSGRLTEHSGEIPELLESLKAALRDLARAAARIEAITVGAGDLVEAVQGTLKTTNRTLQSADRLITQDLRQATRQLSGLTSAIDQLVADAGPGITQFSRDGLVSLNKLIQEARRLVSSMDRVMERIESDPERFLFGNQVPEHSLP